jgi:hypothetical protein
MSLETRQQEERDLGGREADETLVVDLSDGALSALSLALPIERAIWCLRPAPQPAPRSGSLARYSFSRLCTAQSSCRTAATSDPGHARRVPTPNRRPSPRQSRSPVTLSR